MLPEESSRSKAHVLLLVLLPVLLTLIFALLIIVRRLRTLKVEAPREVAWWGNGPVLGTSVWPRDPGALETFVNELEDYGVYGSGRTLVVPATEAERDIACSFAMRLADAPWLAAAILDVGERAGAGSGAPPLVTPTPNPRMPRLTPPSVAAPRQLSSQASSSVAPGRAPSTSGGRSQSRPTIQGFIPPGVGSASPPPVVTPPPEAETKSEVKTAYSSRPPRKKTMLGLPAIRSSSPPSMVTAPPSSAPPIEASVSPITSTDRPGPSASLEPFRRKRGARATVRMMVPVSGTDRAMTPSPANDAAGEEDAFLLTRPVPVDGDQTAHRAGRAVHLGSESAHAGASNAVMRAAVRLLGDDDDESAKIRRSAAPGPMTAAPEPGGVTGVALAWNGPLSGPVLRRAARLAHRVMVVVSSGMSVIDLARIQTRLGREKGVGYVLVNVGDAYVDLQDRVGPVEEFWESSGEAEGKDSRRP